MLASFRKRLARWTLQRQGMDGGGFRLHRRRLYIIPTRLGLVYATMLLAMLLGGLNYGSNPALLFTFLLAAAAWVAMHHAHANLSGLEGQVEGRSLAAEPAGAVEWHVVLKAPTGSWRVDLELDGPARPGLESPPVISVAPGQEVHALWTQPEAASPRRIRLATRHPLGLFRAWTWLHPATPAPPLAEAAGRRIVVPDGDGAAGWSVDGDGDVVSLRAWRSGEPFRRIAWRASARAGRLVVMERAWTASGTEPLRCPQVRPRMAAPAAADFDRRALGMALLALGGASLMQLGKVPWLAGLALPTALAWRWWLERRSASLPPRWVKLPLAVGAAVAVMVAFRTWNGLAAGSALLTTMAALKLTETRDRRDLAVLFFLAAFLAYAALLADGSPMTLLVSLGVAWLALGALAARARPAGSPGEWPLLAQSIRTLLWSLPLAALLFLFVPRIDGHFWSLPSDGRAKSGLADEMRPGDISDLSLSDDPVMRVFFSDRLPPRSQRYWRGPVLHEFDGGTWRVARGTPYPLTRSQPRGRPIHYRVLLEPTQHSYVPLLERSLDWTLEGASLGWDLGVTVPQPITATLAYDATSDATARIEGPLPLSLRRRALQWPSGTNPRTVSWANELRDTYAQDEDLIDAVLRRFGEPPFTYTLTPPQLDDINAVDDFLFVSRRGFCGHYASALAAVARAAGIPARVVTGYQGGEWNRVGRYLLVRQSDAHAWTELWLPPRGWVRVDPTAAIAPERVEQGLDEALGADEPVPGRLYDRWPWLGQARAWMDAVRTEWQVRFLQFDRQAQERLAAVLGFGQDGLASLVRALVVVMAVAGSVLLVFALRGGLPRWPSPEERRWHRACRHAARLGCPREAAEGETTYAARVAMTLPAMAEEIRAAANEYVAWRYWRQP